MHLASKWTPLIHREKLEEWDNGEQQVHESNGYKSQK